MKQRAANGGAVPGTSGPAPCPTGPTSRQAVAHTRALDACREGMCEYREDRLWRRRCEGSWRGATQFRCMRCPKLQGGWAKHGGSQTQAQANCQGWLLLLVACLPVLTGAHSPVLFTTIHSQGPSLLSFVCFTLSIVDTHNRFIASLHSLYPEPISRRFIPFASLYGGSHQGAADKFHRLDFCHDAPRFNTTRQPWASLIEPPVPVHRAC